MLSSWLAKVVLVKLILVQVTFKLRIFSISNPSYWSSSLLLCTINLNSWWIRTSKYPATPWSSMYFQIFECSNIRSCYHPLLLLLVISASPALFHPKSSQVFLTFSWWAMDTVLLLSLLHSFEPLAYYRRNLLNVLFMIIDFVFVKALPSLFLPHRFHMLLATISRSF